MAVLKSESRRGNRTVLSVVAIAGLVSILSSCLNPVAELVAEDVLVERAGGRPGIVSVFPARGATDVSTDTTIDVVFSADMAITPENADALATSLRAYADTQDLGGTVSYDPSSRRLSLIGATLPRGRQITAEVPGDVRNIGGAGLGTPERWTFTTNEINPLEVRMDVTVDPALGVGDDAPLYAWGASVSFDAETGAFSFLGLERVPDEGGTVFLDTSFLQADRDIVFGLLQDLDNSIADGTDAETLGVLLAASADPNDPAFGKIPPLEWADQLYDPLFFSSDRRWLYLAGSRNGVVRNEAVDFWGKSDDFLLNLNPALINDDRQDWADGSPSTFWSNIDAHAARGTAYAMTATLSRTPTETDTPGGSGPLRAVLTDTSQSFEVNRYDELWFEFTTGDDDANLPQVRVESSTAFSRVAVIPADFRFEPDVEVLLMAAANGSFNQGTSRGMFYSSTSTTTSNQDDNPEGDLRIVTSTRYFVQVVVADIRSDFARPLTGTIDIRLVVPEG
jgi:hypothetical protein